MQKGEVDLDKDDVALNEISQLARKRRIQRMKRWIITVLLLLILTPTLLCIILFFKMNDMQKQINMLMRNEKMYSEEKERSSYLSSNSRNSSYQFNLLKLNSVFQDTPNKLENLFQNELINSNDISLLGEAKELIVNTDYISNSNTDYGETSNNYSNLGLVKNTLVSNEVSANEDKNNSVKEDAKQRTDENDVDSKNSDVDTSKIAENSDGKDSSESQKTTKDTQKDSENEVKKQDISENKNRKEVYLTFDDGPSKYTSDILDLLAEYNVKATFFVIGKTDKNSKNLYKRIVEEGHAIGMHSYSHDYNEIYQSLDNFEKDFNKIHKLLFETTGKEVKLYRFPGGSGNGVSNVDMSVFIKFLYEHSVTYFDWNVVSGDATGEVLTPKQMYDNVINGVKVNKKSIVLMHDTDSKEDTVKTLKMILDELSKEKVDILPLNENVVSMQQIKVNSVVHMK